MRVTKFSITNEIFLFKNIQCFNASVEFVKSIKFVAVFRVFSFFHSAIRSSSCIQNAIQHPKTFSSRVHNFGTLFFT